MQESVIPHSEFVATSTPVFIVGALFWGGLYLPTSIGGTYSVILWAIYLWFLAILFLTLLLRKDGVINIWLIANSILMIATLFAATIVSPFPEYRWGGLLPYLVLALMFPTSLREVTLGDKLCRWVVVANVINIAVGLGVILHIDLVSNFLVSHYSSFYSELVPFMTSSGKPILGFGSHSTGAFFYYLFFFINFETYKIRKEWSALVFALGYVGLCAALLSVTAFALTSVAAFQLMRYSAKRRPKLTWALASLAVAATLGVVYYFVPDTRDWAIAWKFVSGIVSSPTNGFLGRFTELGTLYGTVSYIRDRPFHPVGLGFRGDLMFGDSGPVEYYLRGSIPLLLAMYGGLFTFLRKNLLSKTHAWILFLAIMAFETGFSSMIYFRTPYLLPFFVIYLNLLIREQNERKTNSLTLQSA